MQLYWLADDAKYVGTQTEALKSKQQWRMDEIPTDKYGLMAFLNSYIEGKTETLEAEAEAEGEELVKVEPDIIYAPAGPAPEVDIIEKIMATEGTEFGRILQAALERLGELRLAGLPLLSKLMPKDARTNTSVERGLGFLVLSQPPAP